MATNSDQKGYDHQFLDQIPDELLCLICTLIARDPQQATCCGKVYCKACIDELAEHSNTCPQCREDVNCFPDKRSDRNIKSLKCKCDNFTHGCEWKGELRYIDEHLTTCEYAPLPCPNECSDDEGEIRRVLRKDIEKHKNECLRRLYTCPHCYEEGEYFDMTSYHLDICSEVEVPCQNEGCDELIPRSEMEDHISHLCEYEMVPCKYEVIGCKTTLLRKDIKEHEEDYQQHLQIAIKAVHDVTISSAMTECSVESLRKHLYSNDNFMDRQKAEDRFDDIQTTARETFLIQYNTLIDINKYLQNLHSFIIAQKKEICELRSIITTLRRQGDMFDTMGELLHSSVIEDKLQVHPNVMKFTDFARRKSRNEVIHSQPFYSSPGGYKMCLGVYANGYKDGKNNHIALYIYLMRGENDDHLVWPFTGTVTIELLNQLEDEGHHQVKIRFLSRESSSKRVSKDDGDRADTGYGRQKFISHTDLGYNNTGRFKRQYLKDDCLYFRYEVCCKTAKPWLAATSTF